jgi:hypothetical protein
MSKGRNNKEYSKELEENQKNDRHKSIPFNNNLKCKWTNFSN